MILTASHFGKDATLHRVCCDSSGDTDLPFVLRRRQFPVKLAWAMTINKAEGQTLRDRLGVYLPKPVFSHGQLYVALSRAATSNSVSVVVQNHEDQQRKTGKSSPRSNTASVYITWGLARALRALASAVRAGRII